MPDRQHDLSHDDPEGGHDPDSLRDAAKRMHATKAGAQAGANDKDRSKDDPEGGHDAGALKDAARKMGTDR